MVIVDGKNRMTCSQKGEDNFLQNYKGPVFPREVETDEHSKASARLFIDNPNGLHWQIVKQTVAICKVSSVL